MKAKHTHVTNRKSTLTEEHRREIVRLNRDGKLTWNQLATQYAVSRMTIYRIVKKSAMLKREAGQPINQGQEVDHDIRLRVYSSYG